MSKTISILLLSFLFTLSGCVSQSSMSLTNSSVGTNEKFSDSNNEIVQKISESSKSDKQYPTVWTVVFDLNDFNNPDENLTVWSSQNDRYNKLLDKNSSLYKMNGGVEIDLMNCAGYLASGKIYVGKNKPEAESPNWLLKLFRETIAKDAEEKIKKCDVPFENKNISTDEVAFNQAFAVSPRNEQRKSIKISSKIDTQKLFDSLPENVKKEAKASVVRNDFKQSDSSLNLINDNWTDLDGDGAIDLIQVLTDKDATIFLLEKDGWKVVANVGR